jgi:O-antigen ligase
LICVAGYTLTAVGRVHQLFPGLQGLRPATLTGLLAIVLFWVDRRDMRRAHHLLIAPTKYLLALLLWMTLSMTGALVPGASFELVFDNFLKTVLMFFVTAGSVRGAHDVERLAMVYLGGATVYATVVISRFELGAGDAWRLGRLYYYDANDFATLVVTAMPFGLYLLHAGRSFHARAAAALSLSILTLAFVRTGSRGGFLALIAVGAFLVWRYTAIPFRWRVSAAALVTVLVLATASDQYWKQMNTIVSDVDYNRTEESGRMQIWQRGIGYMLRNPVFGVGPANFPAAEGRLSPFANRQEFGIGVRWNAAHNSFVQIGAELGIPGLVMFVGIIATTFAALRRVGRSRPHPAGSEAAKALTQALIASLLGFVVGAFFLSLAYAEMFYMLAALAVGLHKTASADR